VRTGGGEPHAIKRTGISTTKTLVGEIKLTNVEYVLSMKKNLISNGSIINSGNIVVFSDLYCWIFNKGNYHDIMAIRYRDPSDGLYRFGNNFKASIINLVATKNVSINKVAELCYKHYSHLSFQGLFHLLKQNKVHGLPLVNFLHIACKNYLAK